MAVVCRRYVVDDCLECDVRLDHAHSPQSHEAYERSIYF